MKRDDSFKRGKNNIDMILLNILCNGDCYGYQLSQLVREYSGHMLSLPEGSLYPSLYRMEELGYITGKKKLVARRMERIYYHIEPSGREYLNQLIADYEHLNAAIQKIMQCGKEYELTVQNTTFMGDSRR